MDSNVVKDCFEKSVPVDVRLPDGRQKRGRICAIGGVGQNILASVACESGDTLRSVPARDLALALGKV